MDRKNIINESLFNIYVDTLYNSNEFTRIDCFYDIENKKIFSILYFDNDFVCVEVNAKEVFI